MKDHQVLITYATMSGSTQEIAEFIVRELREMGLDVEIQPCRSVNDLTEYRAVVLGAPLYMFHLHKDALHFLSRNQKRLCAMPVAVFAGGPFGADAENEMPEVRKNLETELGRYPWLNPISVQLVGGRFDPTRLRFPYNLIPALKQSPASDVRDWEEIRGWARSLPDLFDLPIPQADAERNLG
jgi:menaquinone-dependent protoporphyrinogen oxidase